MLKIATDKHFSELVSEKYVDAFYAKQLDKFTHRDPYPFAFLKDFWRPGFYEQLSSFKPSLNTYYVPEGKDETDIFFEPFDFEPFVRLVYGKTFRCFLASLIGRSTFVRHPESYPQLRTMKSNANGLFIHNDEEAPYNGVVFFNLNDGWTAGSGGELVVWKKIGEMRFRKLFEFPPVGNSLSVMLLSQHSYHSVNKLRGDWTRTNILVEAQFQ